MSHAFSTAAGAIGVLAMMSVSTQAQTTPQQSTATYEDWMMRCQMQAGPPPLKSCEVVQFTQAQGQAGVLTQIAIGNAKKGDPLKLVIQVPIDVWLPAGVKLLAGEKDPGLAVTFKRCVPGACFADFDIKDDVIKKFRTATELGKLQFKDVNQKDIALPVSFKGFGAAMDAMSKE